MTSQDPNTLIGGIPFRIHNLREEEAKRLLFALESENAELRKRIETPHCHLAAQGRGDCEHAIGLPGLHSEVEHDGPDTEDIYGKPNGWCWHCWHTHQILALQQRISELRGQLREVALCAETLRIPNKYAEIQIDADLIDKIRREFNPPESDGPTCECCRNLIEPGDEHLTEDPVYLCGKCLCELEPPEEEQDHADESHEN